MDEAERRRLKKLGKKLVGQQSRELQERLREANPTPIGSDEWVKGYREGTMRERQLRAAPPDLLIAEQVQREFVLLSVEEQGLGGLFGVPTLYHECPVCRDVLHSAPQQSIACSCGNLYVDVVALQVATRSVEQVRLVKLIGRSESSTTTDPIT